jgi:hypothetical protein
MDNSSQLPDGDLRRLLNQGANVVGKVYAQTLNFLFVRAESGACLWLQRGWEAGLLVTGAGLWIYILNAGDINFLYHDWAEGIGHRIAFLQDAVQTGSLPLHMPDESALRNVTDRYLSIPDTILSPQVLLLSFMDLGKFVVFNTVLMYSLGFLGMMKLTRRYQLSPIPALAMFFIISFNGRITDLIVVGDIHWAGYFLLPWFAYYILQAVEESVEWVWTLKISFVLMLVFLQGSFHMYLISLVFMGLLALTSRRLLVPMVRGGTFSLLASMVRITSPALNAGDIDTEFLSGFDSGLQALTSTIDLRPMTREFVFRGSTISPLGWWEIDHYVGLMGLLFIVAFGIGSWIRRPAEGVQYRELIVPTGVLLILSVGRIFKPISMLGIPMLSSQRVATRFFILPLLMLTILAALHLQKVVNEAKLSARIKTLLAGCALILVNDIWQHEKLWRVVRLPELFDARDVDLSLAYVANHPDPEYLTAVAIGAAVSALALLAMSFLSYREIHREKNGVGMESSGRDGDG